MEQFILADCFGLIVLNYSCWKQTVQNVDLLLSKNDKFNVVVVDNLSPNNDFEALSEYYKDNQYVHVCSTDENGGYAKGNNFGIKFLLQLQPKISYIGVMNPDVKIISNDIFSSLIHKMELNPKIVWIAPLMIENNGINLMRIGWDLWDYNEVLRSSLYLSLKSKNHVRFDYKSSTIQFDVIQGSFFVIRKEIFETLGYFDENTFMYYEENILSARLRLLNSDFKAAVAPDLIYIHEHNFERKPIKQKKNNMRMKRLSAIYYLQNVLKCHWIKVIFYKSISWIFINIVLDIRELGHRLLR